mgnify:CR=1 FL=1
MLEYLLNSKTKRRFQDLAKRLKKKVEGFNYDPKDSIPASPVHANFQSIFKKKWETFTEKEKEDLWHLKYWAKDPEWLENMLINRYKLTDKEKSKGPINDVALPENAKKPKNSFSLFLGVNLPIKDLLAA